VKGRHVEPEKVKGLYLGPDGAWSTSQDRDPAAAAERLGLARKSARDRSPSHAERPANVGGGVTGARP